jgi:CPA1 family monovalent cation:H+ antiporter
MSTSLISFEAVYNILISVTIITFITRKLRFPQTIALILVGLYSTIFTRFNLPFLEADIFMSILLPPILFQEALHLNIFDLIDDIDSILSYAVLGTITMVLSISVFSWFIFGFSVIEALLLGIIIAPTDPVAVISSFKSMGIFKRFQLLVAGESLFNDGVAIVIYSILMSVAMQVNLTALDMAKLSVITVFGGLILGVLSGYLAHFLFCWSDDKFAEVLITFIVAFGVFRLAEELGASGVISTVIAGVIINYRSKNYGGLGAPSIDFLDALWEFVAFMAQSIAFIFIGMNTETSLLVTYIGPVFVIIIFTILARYLMVLSVAEIVRHIRGKVIPNNWTLGMAWSGLRGGVSVVLALGAASIGLRHGEEILAITFGIVLISNIVQGITMSKVLGILNLSDINVELLDDLSTENDDQQRSEV